MNESASSLIDDVAQWFDGAGVSAVACLWLPAVSVFVDEYYENFEYDLIGPAARLKIAKVLGRHGFTQRTGRIFESPRGRIEFPLPTRTLASDPALELEKVIGRGASLALATPTQVVLATWRREGPRLDDARHADLVDLVRRQPANLEKVADWLRRTGARAAYAKALPVLGAAQEQGILQRHGKRGSR